MCLTDDPNGIGRGIETFPLPDLGAGYREQDGWPKVGIFQSTLYDLRGLTLFLDLDLVILDSLEEFFKIEPGGLRMCRDFIPSPKRRLKAFLDGRSVPGNSSVFGFWIGEQTQIYNHFIRDPQAAFRRFPNEQEFLSHYATNRGFWNSRWCRSFKRHCRYTLQPWRKPTTPSGAKIIVFHGQPKPDPLDHVEWIYNHWHNYR